MGFGVKDGAGALSRNTNNSVQVAEKVNSDGVIIDFYTYGEATEVSEEIYVVGDTALVSEAVNGQSGLSVVTGHNLVESNILVLANSINSFINDDDHDIENQLNTIEKYLINLRRSVYP